MDEVQKLLFEEETDERFTLINLQLPVGIISGKWWGPKDVRPVVCLHGWMDNCGVFDTLIPLLPKEYSFLAIDLPGHGRSCRYPPGMIYSYYDTVVLLERIRKTYKWEKLSLMAHSLNSFTGYFYSATFSDKIDLFIALDNFAPDDTDSVALMKDNMRQLLRVDDLEMNARESEPPSYNYEQWVEKIIQASGGSVNSATAKFLLTRSLEQSKKYPGQYFFNFDRRLKGLAFPARHPEDQLTIGKQISCPVLMLMAKDSYMRNTNPLAVRPEVFAENNRNFYIRHGPGSHHFFLTHPEAYADHIGQFLSKCRMVKGKL